MTTVAWDGKTLAADRRVTFGSTADCEITKIARGPNGALIGIAGRMVVGAALLRWFQGGSEGERPNLGETDDGVMAVVIHPDGSLDLHDRAGWARIEAPIYAIGSGYEFALGAMAMGADAVAAIHIAHRFDTKTGDTVDTLILHTGPRLVAES